MYQEGGTSILIRSMPGGTVLSREKKDQVNATFDLTREHLRETISEGISQRSGKPRAFRGQVAVPLEGHASLVSRRGVEWRTSGFPYQSSACDGDREIGHGRRLFGRRVWRFRVSALTRSEMYRSSIFIVISSGRGSRAAPPRWAPATKGFGESSVTHWLAPLIPAFFFEEAKALLPIALQNEWCPEIGCPVLALFPHPYLSGSERVGRTLALLEHAGVEVSHQCCGRFIVDAP
jgi:hypothetical protein